MACKWTTLAEALEAFAIATSGHQGAGHIRPLHWYVSCRLVLEGGFHPDDVTPRPPFVVETTGSGQNRRHKLVYDESAGGVGERTVLGGLKTKAVDVTVAKDSVGPCVAVSMKGTLNAFRNLTNRMEEAVGDCTNIHLSYPAMVYGFLHVLRGSRDGVAPSTTPSTIVLDDQGRYHTRDVAIVGQESVSEGVLRYHHALCGLADRQAARDELTRYEAVALVLVETEDVGTGDIIPWYPSQESPLRFDTFFNKLYAAYDERFVYSAPELARPADPRRNTRRLEWDPKSPALAQCVAAEFAARVASQ